MSRRIRRLPALVLALLGLGGQIAASAHWIVERHVSCAEHVGELIEIASRTENSHSMTPAAVFARAPAAHGHQHCALQALRRDRGWEGTAPQVAVSLTAVPLSPWAAPHPTPPAPIEPIVLAPKLAPPA